MHSGKCIELHLILICTHTYLYMHMHNSTQVKYACIYIPTVACIVKNQQWHKIMQCMDTYLHTLHARYIMCIQDYAHLESPKSAIFANISPDSSLWTITLRAARSRWTQLLWKWQWYNNVLINKHIHIATCKDDSTNVLVALSQDWYRITM